MYEDERKEKFTFFTLNKLVNLKQKLIKFYIVKIVTIMKLMKKNIVFYMEDIKDVLK